MLPRGSLAAIRSVGIHQLFNVAPTCADICHGVVEATEAIFSTMREAHLLARPLMGTRGKEASTSAHSASSNKKNPGCPVLPDVALTQWPDIAFPLESLRHTL